MLPAHGRYEFSPITRRPKWRWPNGGGLAFYIALNVEHYAFAEGLTEDLVPGMSQPDVLNTSWREYGTRVGVWRLQELFHSLDLPATILLNSSVCDSQPEIVAACVEQGCEIASHGRTNSESQAGLSPDEEKKLIGDVTDTLTGQTGNRPQGWLGPWLGETPQTPELLKGAGYRYILDWCAGDQPIWLRTEQGPILSIPYSQEINDSSAIIGRFVNAAEFSDMIIDQVDEMLDQSSDHALVFGLAIHANIAGQPFRLRQLRRALAHVSARRESIWITRACDIADWIYEKPERAV